MPHSLEQPNNRQCALMIAFLFILVLIALSACATAPIPTTTPTTEYPTPAVYPTRIPTPAIPQDWEYRWLKKIPCSAPCVEGVTPGKTFADEAVEILSQNSLFKNVRREPSYGFKWESVSWDWVGCCHGGNSFYSPYTSKTIILIVPNFGIRYSLEEVMQAYGEPTHVLATARDIPSEVHNYCQDIHFLYIPYGIALYRQKCNSELKWDESMYFDDVRFFIPTLVEYTANDSFAAQHPTWIIPWQGLKTFEYYCRDEKGGKYCRGEWQ